MAQVVTKRHPIRAALWRLLIGLGLVIWFTFAQPVIGLDNPPSVLLNWGVVMVGAMVLAVVLALIIPAKKPKGPPPAAMTTASSPAAASADASTSPQAVEQAPGDADGGSQDEAESQ